MPESKRIFVILDPTTMEQPSLLMAESFAQDYSAQADTPATIHAYCCIDEKSIREDIGVDAEQAKADVRERIGAWVERIVAHTRSLGLTVDTEIEVSLNWRDSIATAACGHDTMLVVKGMSQNPRFMRVFRDAADWRLLRDCNCPVYLVKTSPNRPVRNVLAAIKHRTEKQAYTDANNRILETARGIASGLGAELHVVTAYENNFNYPDRQKFADRCGLPRNRVRAEMGSPQNAIATVASEIGADLVVIARVGKPGDKRDVGHTSEKLIDSLNANLLVLPMTADQ